MNVAKNHLRAPLRPKIAKFHSELKRSFGLLGMIGFSLSIVMRCDILGPISIWGRLANHPRSWSALGGVLVAGIYADGPPVMICSWTSINIVSCVAYSMAEMRSEYPVTGGQYSRVFAQKCP